MSGGELQLPPGFRFHPTDEELVNHYLCRKCTAQSITVPVIAEIDLYRHDPWQLPGMALYGEKEWYFFSPRDRKYPNGLRPNRAAGSGYWKATGADKPIGLPKPMGIKKSLVFYAGKAPKGEKTNWIMHEYRLAGVDRSVRKRNSLRLDEWVLCRIYNKKGPSDKHMHQFTKKEEVPAVMPQTQTSSEYLYNLENSDSVPRLYTDSSCSEKFPSPCEREVQSQPTAWMQDWDNRHVNDQPETDMMSPMLRDPLFQDILMYLQKQS